MSMGLSRFFNIVILAAALLGAARSSFAQEEDKISPSLRKALENTDGPIPIIVLLRQVPIRTPAYLGPITSAEVEVSLKRASLMAQADLRDRVRELADKTNTLEGEPAIRNYRFFWIENALMATVKPDLISEFADRDDVAKVLLDRRLHLAPDFREMTDTDGGAYTYGLEKIGVSQLREKYPDITGHGVTVGIVDTGLDATHPEMEGKKIIFKDFVGDKTTAYDDNGHGTHVAGTISGVGAGGTQIGVAPGVSTLVIAKVFSAEGGADSSSLLRGMEWVANPDGKLNSENRPRVVNNSWGGPLTADISNDPFSPAVLNWVNLNIFPSFAAGNSGPGPSSIGSPGGLPHAFAVGATDENDEIAEFSSRGPVDLVVDGKPQRLTKPDVSAPGSAIYSSVPGGKYAKLSGTSMATPHLTGAVALAVQAKPAMTVAEIRDLLTSTAKDLGDHNTFGSGRLDIFSAVEKLSTKMDFDNPTN